MTKLKSGVARGGHIKPMVFRADARKTSSPGLCIPSANGGLLFTIRHWIITIYVDQS